MQKYLERTNQVFSYELTPSKDNLTDDDDEEEGDNDGDDSGAVMI